MQKIVRTPFGGMGLLFQTSASQRLCASRFSPIFLSRLKDTDLKSPMGLSASIVRGETKRRGGRRRNIAVRVGCVSGPCKLACEDRSCSNRGMDTIPPLHSFINLSSALRAGRPHEHGSGVPWLQAQSVPAALSDVAAPLRWGVIAAEPPLLLLLHLEMRPTPLPAAGFFIV